MSRLEFEDLKNMYNIVESLNTIRRDYQHIVSTNNIYWKMWDGVSRVRYLSRGEVNR